jgi:hypothetical protein
MQDLTPALPHLRVRYLEGSCDGAPRATLTTRLAKDRINSVTVASPGTWIIDVGLGTRRSSVLLPRYSGGCGDTGHQFVGDPDCDVASAAGYEDVFNECKRPRG